MKRRLGDPMPLVLGGTPYAAAQLMGLQLADVVQLVTEREGRAPDAVTLTYPANWGPYKKELFSQIPRTAGLRDVRMLTEPEAAAAHYASNERLDEGALVAVYDLGGGTFDATVLRTAGKGFEILGTPEGIEGLGGIDFDEAVFNHVDRSLGGPLSGLDPSDPHDTSAVIRLRQDCARAKEALSADTEATIPVMLPKLQTEVRLTRGEFEDMIRPSISATIEALRRALLSAGVTPDHLSTVLLVGGSSRIPLVSQMVSAELGRPTAVDAHPKHAIVLGAAAMSGRGFVNDRGQFTGPPSGAAPVTTAMAQGGPRTGANPRAPRTGGFPTGQHGAVRPPTGPLSTGQTAAVRPMGLPMRPAGPVAGMPGPALRGAGSKRKGKATGADGDADEATNHRRRLAMIGAAIALLTLLAGGGTFVYRQVSNATAAAPAAPPAAVVAPAPTTTTEPVPAQQAAATVAPTRAPHNTGGGTAGSGGGRGRPTARHTDCCRTNRGGDQGGDQGQGHAEPGRPQNQDQQNPDRRATRAATITAGDNQAAVKVPATMSPVADLRPQHRTP